MIFKITDVVFLWPCANFDDLVWYGLGAGISTAAGIPDFRGPNGVWTLEKEGKSPNCNITFDKAVPTFSHRILVHMEKLGKLELSNIHNYQGPLKSIKSKFCLDLVT